LQGQNLHGHSFDSQGVIYGEFPALTPGMQHLAAVLLATQTFVQKLPGFV
jgi:hypothetical protein